MKVDTKNETQRYWDEVLNKMGLSMDSGLPPARHRKGRLERVAFTAGGSQDIVRLDEQEYVRESGRVVPKGRGPDN